MCAIFINMFPCLDMDPKPSPLWTSFYRLRLATVSPRASARAEMSGAFLGVFQNRVPLNSLTNGLFGGSTPFDTQSSNPCGTKGDHQSCLHCRSLHLRPKLKQEPKLLHFAKFWANQTIPKQKNIEFSMSISIVHTIVVASARW
jgi:hypothetical protein